MSWQCDSLKCHFYRADFGLKQTVKPGNQTTLTLLILGTHRTSWQQRLSARTVAKARVAKSCRWRKAEWRKLAGVPGKTPYRAWAGLGLTRSKMQQIYLYIIYVTDLRRDQKPSRQSLIPCENLDAPLVPTIYSDCSDWNLILPVWLGWFPPDWNISNRTVKTPNQNQKKTPIRIRRTGIPIGWKQS
jgi:hypothetical protein